jgi:hypothetical protein
LCKTLCCQGEEAWQSQKKCWKGCKGPDGFYGPDGLAKQSSKVLVERMMQAELTERPGCEKKRSGRKANRQPPQWEFG